MVLNLYVRSRTRCLPTVLPYFGRAHPLPITPPWVCVLGLEDSICDEPDEMTTAEVAGIWIGIVTGVIAILVSMWQGYEKCAGNR